MISCGGKPIAIDQNVVGARGNFSSRSKVSACPASSNAITTTAAPSAAHQLGVVDERVLALFERDRIHHCFAHARISGRPRSPRISRNRSSAGRARCRAPPRSNWERRLRLFRIRQALVHIDVEDCRTCVLHLIARHGERFDVVASGNELAKARRAGDIGAFADISEGDCRRIVNASKPDRRRCCSTPGICRGFLPAAAAAISADVIGGRACSVPTMLTMPEEANSLICSAIIARLSS